MKNYLFYPIYIFLIVILLDKLFYIPEVQNLLVKNNYNFYDMIFKFEDLVYKDHIEKKIYKYNSKEDLLSDTLVFFGTSRGDIFREFSAGDVKNNPFLLNENKILNKPVIAHIIKGGSFFHIYQLYNHVIKKYPKKTLYAFEINYGSFNHNSYFRRRKDVENLYFEQFLDIYSQLSIQQKADYIASRFFITSTMNISFLLPFKSSVASHEENLRSLFFIYKGQLQHRNDNLNNFVTHGTLEGQENEDVKKEYVKFIENQMETVHYKFKEDTTDLNLIYKLVDDVGKQNLKVIFFRPKIHKEMRKAIDNNYGTKEKEWIVKIKKYINDNNLEFIDLEDPSEIKCNYFSDPSHLSKTCAPEIIEKFNNLYR